METSQWVQLMTRRESINEAKEAIFSIGDIGSKQGYLPAAIKYFLNVLSKSPSVKEKRTTTKKLLLPRF